MAQGLTLSACRPGQATAAGDSGPGPWQPQAPPHLREVASTLRLLGHQGQELKAAPEQRQQQLQEGLNCRSLVETDGFTASCANHEAFLRLDSLQVWS